MRRLYIIITLLTIIITKVEAATFQGLGILSGTRESEAKDVSADGTTIVGCSYGSNFYGASSSEAFRWTQNDGMQGLGYLSGGFASKALSVSENGTSIVGIYVLNNSNRTQRAIKWTANGEMQDLGCTATGYNLFSGAFGISNDGSKITGWSSSSSYTEAFKYENSTLTGIGYLPNYSTSQAWDISGDGSTIVGRSNNMAFKYSNGSMVALGDLPGVWEIINSLATAVSYDGSIIVGESYSNTNNEAFIWQNGIMTGLGYLAGDIASSADAIIANGETIVGYSTNGANSKAVLWDADGIHDLNNFLITQYGLNLSGWRLTDATGISDDGSVICGNGINPQGYKEAWVAVIPEPGTLFLLGLGGLFLRNKR